jgi:hypothetical protein
VLVLFGLYERNFWRPLFESLPTAPLSKNLAVILLILMALVQL